VVSPMKYYRKLSFVILIIIFFTSLYYSLGVDFKGDLGNITINDFRGDLKNISLNLSSELLGIIITVFLIDKGIKEEAEAKRRKLLQIVFNRLTIKSELGLMMSIARPTAPEGSITSYLDLCNENYYEYIRKLDFSADGPGKWSNTGKNMNWAEYIAHISGEFNDSINKIITNYGMHLETEELELLQSVIDSNFMTHAVKIYPMLMNAKGGLADYHLFDVNGSKEMIEEHLSQLWKVSNLANKYYLPKDAIDIPPKAFLN
jgi:hypothetical protein